LLMITELMTNALKHAYPDGRGGSVQISVNGTKRELMLQVDDDGRGLPRDFDLRAGGGLGMRIVEGLVAQLHGELQIEPRAPGAHFRVQLPTDEAWNGTRDVVWDAMKQAAEMRSGVI